MNAPLAVLKFGSSVLADRACLPAVVHEVYRYYRRGCEVLVVVSAIGRYTDCLLEQARQIADPITADIALAELLATGEQQSAALLSIALDRAGIDSTLLSPAGIELMLSGHRLDAVPVAVNCKRLRAALKSTRVAVLPGFSGQHLQGGTALLGRGGSDLTAVFLAEQLAADECRLLKDVDGIYERDPAGTGDTDKRPHRYGAVTYDEALQVSNELVQPKAIERLRSTKRIAKLSALLREDGTDIGMPRSRIDDAKVAAPLKVLLLGLGEVGQGVIQHLKPLSAFFEVTGISVRDVYKQRECNVSRSLLDTDINKLLARPYDLVVDVCDDPTTAYVVIRQCLQAGRRAVTASKRLVVDRGVELTALAAKSRTSFSYSAAVGGGAPMIETLALARKQGAISRLRGVLNGTCNYVLDRIAEGALFQCAVMEAQNCGFAEAKVSRDLSGEDSEDKLRILARLAFGNDTDRIVISRLGLERVGSEQLARAKQRGEIIRLVATFEAAGRASVQPELLPADDYLAGARRQESRLVINGSNGREWQVSGKGAGRWPTAEAVIADMLEIHAQGAREVTEPTCSMVFKVTRPLLPMA